MPNYRECLKKNKENNMEKTPFLIIAETDSSRLPRVCHSNNVDLTSVQSHSNTRQRVVRSTALTHTHI